MTSDASTTPQDGATAREPRQRRGGGVGALSPALALQRIGPVLALILLTTAMGVSGAETMLTADSHVAAIYLARGAPPLGAIQSIDDAKTAAGKIVVVGFDGLGDEFAAIENGAEAATVVEFPAKIGELGVNTPVAAVKGEKAPAFVDTGTIAATKEIVVKFK